MNMEAIDNQRVVRLALEKIRRDGGTQPRAELNEEWATEIAERLADGSKFPAVTVYQDGTDLWLADGFHRCRGAELAGLEYIDAYVVTGTRQDARDYANSGAPNGRHGLRESKADRWRRIENMLRDHPDWSLRQVAGHCEVGHDTVKRVRHAICTNSTDEGERTVTRNGTTYTMSTGNIGRTPEPLDEEQEEAQSEVMGSLMGGDITREEANERLADIDPQWDERARQPEPAHYLTIGTGQNEWYTPAEYIAMARDVMGGIDLDPASCEEANETVKAAQFYTKEDDGLSKEWQGRVWLNPPYSRDLMPAFVQKLCAEYEDGGVEQAILVSHNNTDTNWFQSLAIHATAICFPKKRIRFYRDEDVASPTNGQAFFYLGDNPARFKDVFAQLGIVVMPV